MSTSVVDQIKERLSIVDVVSDYVQLQPAGKHLRGKSPFTEERTPSFFVSPDKDLFHCFSTNKGGDIFSFVQEMERIEFPEALRMLADRAGVKLQATDRRSQDIRSKHLRLLELATKFFQMSLPRYTPAQDYITGRGISADAIEAFQIGYAPDGWQTLSDVLLKKRYTKEDLLAVGLVNQGNNGKVYDKFRGRVMFPITNPRGQVVGFTGRILPEFSEYKGEPVAKYMNSPETSLYQKSKILFGLSVAKRAIMSTGRAIIVEGQMDVVMCWQAGYQETVALSGTALSDEQLHLLKRFCDELVFALDSDRAGIAATDKSVIRALAHGLRIRVVPMPLGSDPADMLRDDTDQWKQLIDAAPDYITFRLRHIEEQTNNSPEKKFTAVRSVLYPVIQATHGVLEQDHALNKIADFLRTTTETVRLDYQQWAQENPIETNLATTTSSRTVTTGPRQQQSAKDTIIGLWLYETKQAEPRIDLEEWLPHLEEIFGGPENLRSIIENAGDDVVFQVEILYADQSDKDFEKNWQLLLDHEKLFQAEQAFKEISKELKAAETNGDQERLQDLLAKSSSLGSEIQKLRQLVRYPL